MIEKERYPNAKGEDNMKVGFIGTGNMAQAIIDGLLKKGTVSKEEVFVSSGHFENAQKLASMHAKVIRKLHHNQISFF